MGALCDPLVALCDPLVALSDPLVALCDPERPAVSAQLGGLAAA